MFEEPTRVEPFSPIRTTPLPNALMRQTWCDLTFIHWRYECEPVARLIPPGLELESFDGSCWIGLVPFRIVDLTLPKAPAVPWLSFFPETNVRTYVRDRQGRPGVWFFSLDASRVLAVAAARVGFGLPYFWAQMDVSTSSGRVRYVSRRVLDRSAHADIDVTAGEAVGAPSELELFLTARFRLVAKRAGRLLRAEIEHQPWPLQRARIDRLDENLTRKAGLPPPRGEPLVHFAKRVDVLVARPEAIPDAKYNRS